MSGVGWGGFVSLSCGAGAGVWDGVGGVRPRARAVMRGGAVSRSDCSREGRAPAEQKPRSLSEHIRSH